MNLSLTEQILKVIIAAAGLTGLIISAISPAETRKQPETAPGQDKPTPEEKTKKAKSHRLKQVLILSTLLVAAVLSIALFALFPSSDQQFYKSLQDRDPRIFSDSKSGVYYLTRLFPDRSFLIGESDLRHDIERTDNTFDMYANTAGFVLRTYNKQIEELVKRGGQVRFLLSDWSEQNRNLDIHAAAVKELSEATREDILKSKQLLDDWMARFRNDPGVYRGKLEVRYTSALVLYTAWIRDKHTPNAAGHIEIQLHGGKDKWPSVRLGRDSGPLIEQLTTEFENLWKDAKEAPTG